MQFHAIKICQMFKWLQPVVIFILIGSASGEHTKFLGMEYFHTILGGQSEESTHFQTLHYRETERIPLVQPWPGKTGNIATHPGQVELIRKYVINGIMGELGEELMAYDHSAGSVRFVMGVLFKTISRITRVCSREACRKSSCPGSVLLPPCGYLCVEVKTPTICDIIIQPSSIEPDKTVVNVTVDDANFPFCRYNHLQIHNSRPFCGKTGGLIVPSNKAALKLKLQNADRFNYERNRYEFGLFKASVSYQVLGIGSYHYRTYRAETIPFPSADSTEAFQLSAKIVSVSISLIHFRPHSYQTGCIKLTCLRFDNRAPSTLTITRGAPEFRFREDALKAVVDLNCTDKSPPPENICPEAGEFTIQIELKAGLFASVEGAFVLNDVQCEKNKSWQCEKLKATDISNEILSFKSTDYPIAYFEYRLQIPKDANGGNAKLYFESIDVEGLSRPAHKDCGAGGIFLLTEYKDWDIGILCGGYGTRTLGYFRSDNPIHLSKEVRIVAKKYFRETTINISFKIQPSKCEGFVNMDMKNYPSSVPSGGSFVKFNTIIGPIGRLEHKRGTCLNILYTETDTHETMLGASLSIRHRGSGVMHLTGTITANMPNFPISTGKKWRGFAVMTGLGEDDDDVQTRYLTRDTPLNTISSFISTLKLDEEFLMPERGESLTFLVQDPPQKCIESSTKDVAGTGNATFALGFCGIVRHRGGGPANIRFLPDKASYGGDIADDCCELRLKFSFSECANMKGETMAKVFSSRHFLKQIRSGDTAAGYGSGTFRSRHFISMGDDEATLILPDNNNISVTVSDVKAPCQITMLYAVKSYKTAIPRSRRIKPKYDGNAFCFGRQCYTFSVEKNMSWLEAEETCVNRSLGHLWSIPSINVYQTVINAGLSHLEASSKDLWNFIPNKNITIDLIIDKRVVHTGGTLSATTFSYVGLSREENSRFMWRNKAPLSFESWYVPHQRSVKKQVYFSDCQTCTNNYSAGNLTESSILQYLHPLLSNAHMCSAAIISDLEHYSLLSIPCDDPFPIDKGPFTLVCEKEKNTARKGEKTGAISQNTKDFHTIKRKNEECPYTWMTFGQTCLKLLSTVIPTGGVNPRKHLMMECRTNGGAIMPTTTLRSKEFRPHIDRLTSFMNVYFPGDHNITVSDKSECRSIIFKENLFNPIREKSIYLYFHDSCEAMTGTVHVMCAAVKRIIHPEIFKCEKGQFKCNDKSCILDTYICDGKRDCVDGSDEAEIVCPMVCWHGEVLSDIRQCNVCQEHEGCVCKKPYVMCERGGCIHPDRLCDGIPDCSDNSDEAACTQTMFTKLEEPQFKCKGDKYVSLHQVDDLVPDCPFPDFSDEQRFLSYLKRGTKTNCDINSVPCFNGYDYCFPRHKLCTYDRTTKGDLTICRNGAHLAIDHCFDHECSDMFKCPNSYCVPYHLVCDGIPDCPGQEDEAKCQKVLSCPYLFKCREENRCVHPNNLLDGVAHCRKHGDDEKVIQNGMCPFKCKCVTNGINCAHVRLFTMPKFSTTATVIYFQYTRLPLVSMPFARYTRLQILDLGGNLYSSEDLFPNVFYTLTHLQILNLSSNFFTHLDPNVFSGLGNLRVLDLRSNLIIQLIITTEFCETFPVLKRLILQNNLIFRVSAIDSCQKLSLQELDIMYNPIDVMDVNDEVASISIATSSTKYCCLAPNLKRCNPVVVDTSSSCTDMLGHISLRSVLWVLVSFCLGGNIFALVWWVRNKAEVYVSIQRQVLCLTLTDFFLSLMFLVILGKDVSYFGVFGQYQSSWRGSVGCKILGGFILFFYEVSTFMQMVIPLDRAVLLGFSRRNKGLGRLTNLTTIISGVILAIVCSSLYLSFMGFEKKHKVPNDLCIAFIGFGRSRILWQFHGIHFVLININFFLGAGFCYVFIIDKAFKSMKEAVQSSDDENVLRYQRIQKRSMIVKAFLCIFCHVAAWLFISVAETLYLFRATNMNFVVYTWIAFTFLLIGPLINPILYTFLTGDFRKRVIVRAKQSIRKSFRRARGKKDMSDNNGHTVCADNSFSMSNTEDKAEKASGSKPTTSKMSAIFQNGEASGIDLGEGTHLHLNELGTDPEDSTILIDDHV